MNSNTDVIWWYSKKSECAYCKISIEFPNLSKCDNCGNLVCTNCAQYVAIYDEGQKKYNGRRFCKECGIPALTLAETKRLVAGYWMRRINHNANIIHKEVSISA